MLFQNPIILGHISTVAVGPDNFLWSLEKHGGGLSGSGFQ